MSNMSPPSWRPNAIATSRGWADPISGELLVGVRDLVTKLEAIEQSKKSRSTPSVSTKVPIAEPVAEPSSIVEPEPVAEPESESVPVEEDSSESVSDDAADEKPKKKTYYKRKS